VDGLVGGDVHIGGVGRELPVGAGRQRAVAVGLAAGGNVDVDVDAGLLDRSLSPMAADHVVGALAGAGEVERDQRLLGGGTTGQEQHRVVVGDIEQAAQVGLGLGGHGHEFRAAMAHFHDRSAGPVPVQHFRLRLAQDRFRQGCRAGTEVERARHVTPVGQDP